MNIGSITYKFETFKALERALKVLKSKNINYTGYGINYLHNGDVNHYYIIDCFHFIGNNPKFDIEDTLISEKIPFKKEVYCEEL